MANSSVIQQSVQDADFVKNEVALRFEIDGLPVSAHLYKKPSDRLFVMLNGAMDRTKAYPNYHRWTWHSKFPGSVLYIADPLLSAFPDLTLAWYAGSSESRVDAHVATLVLAVAERLGVKASNIVAYGSSGGGFASLRLAGAISGIVSVAINPQTNVHRYHEGAVASYLSGAWPGFEVSELKRLECFDAITAFEKSDSRCVFVQNVQDKFHWQNHFLPFLERFGLLPEDCGCSEDGRVRLMVYDSPSGHGPETQEMVPAIVERALEASAR